MPQLEHHGQGPLGDGGNPFPLRSGEGDGIGFQNRDRRHRRRREPPRAPHLESGREFAADPVGARRSSRASDTG
eukprot:76938-Pyramimonas_sp.AAC.1